MPQARSIKGADDIRAKKNATGSTIAKARVVKLDTDSEEILLPGATTDHLYGVTLAAIPNLAYGDIQTRGRAICTAAGALATRGILLMTDTAGKVVAWSAAGGTNAAVVGTLETTAAADGDEVEVELAGPGVIKQG